MTAYRPGLVVYFIACFILLVIAPLVFRPAGYMLIGKKELQ